MKTIKIIDALHLNTDGVKAKMKNGKFQLVHLHQGDLDGACAVYSTMMILILIGAVNYSDVIFGGKKHKKNVGKGRLVKEFLETKGLHREGYYFYDVKAQNIKTMLQKSFASYVKSDHIDCSDFDSVKRINESISLNQPVLISIGFNANSGHALVAIGIEYDEDNEPTKILCLDPGYATPKFTYWNSVIDLKPYKGKYNFRNITETGICQFVQLQDILVITKK